ncbi:hypothetical protein HWV62_18002 [Athelia sp. TMB]|nr:hypothetical protein HWV62_32425 [Athelia sp. TMB]KAF7972432.1 hypothetical protein HWV62_18002 [Athelia sp. TMB]
MLHLGPFTACVTIDGHELEQYQVVISNDGTKATCWIASEAGKQFTVKWKDSSLQRLEKTSGCVTLDGASCGSKCIRPGKAGRRDSAERIHFSTGPTSTRPYMFSHLSLTDQWELSTDDDALLDTEVSSKLGTIKLDIRRVEDGGHYGKFTRGPPEEQIVHEKLKKLATHCVRFGDEVKRAPKRSVKVKYIDKIPMFTFLFQYKPLDVLIAEGIAERPAEVSTVKKRKHVKLEPVHQPTVIEIDSQDEGTANMTSRKRVKKERKQGSLMAPGEVIDLT